MKFLKLTYLLVAGLLLSNVTMAQFSLTGEFRPRTEFNRGYKTLAEADQNWSIPTTQRSRLNAMFQYEIINTKLTLQDVRYWGNQPQLVSNEDYAVSIHEAWADVEFAKNFFVKAGRQELVYDDSRIFGNVGWAQQARSHDVALFKFENDFKIHFGIAHHENNTITDNIYNGPDAYKDMQFIWFNNKWEKSGLSLLVLNNGVPVMESETKEVVKYSQTLGGRYTLGLENVSFAANFYYQMGKHVLDKDISAINFLFEVSTGFGLSGGFEHLSGNSYDKTDKVYAFTPFYGTNHKFNGFMDYFYVGNHMNSVGLNDIYLKYQYAKNKISCGANIHYFMSAGKLAEDASNGLGTELDLFFTYKAHKMAALSAGFSTMFATESMQLLKGGDHTTGQYWGYVMLAVTPTFINK